MGDLKSTEKVKHNCGLAVTHTLHDAYAFIRSLQHRGREACGIAAIGSRIDVIKWAGGVSKVDLIDLHKLLPAHNYRMFLAHVRYATKGKEDRAVLDAHPHFIGGTEINRGDHILVKDVEAVIVHNGQVEFDNKEVCDTKLILDEYLTEGARGILKKIKGSYTLAIADKKRREVMVMRDRFAMKPGVLGMKDGKYCVASEDRALIENGATFIEDLKPGCVYYLSFDGGLRRVDVIKSPKRHCFFEWNYIADLNSIINGVSVRKVREELGVELAKEFSFDDVELISFLPRCPEVAAKKYASELNKEHIFLPLFYKLRGERSFQGTTQEDRKSSIKTNLHLLPDVFHKVRGRTVLVIDDSTIRGTNCQRAKELLLEADAKKIYFLNYTPKIGIVGKDGVKRGCLFGVDMPPEDKFIVRDKAGKNRTDAEISKELGMEVRFLSVKGLFNAFRRAGMNEKDLCSFCIGGKNPFS